MRFLQILRDIEIYHHARHLYIVRVRNSVSQLTSEQSLYWVSFYHFLHYN